jgi:hypothetical protein
MKTTSAKEAVDALELMQQVLNIIWLKAKDAGLKNFRTISRKFMDMQEMTLLFFVKAMKLLMVMLEKIQLKVELVMMQLIGGG